VNLRAQLERTTGSMVAAGGAASPAPASRLLALGGSVCALALLATALLGAPQGGVRFTVLAGAAASNLLLVAGMCVVMQQLRPEIFEQPRALGLLAMLATVTIAVAAVGARLAPGSPELVPLAFLAIIVSALFDRRLGLLAVSCVGVLIAVQPSYRDANALPVMLTAGATAALLVRPVGRRDQSYLWMAGTATAVVLALLVSGVAQGSTRAEMMSSIVRAVATTVGGVIAAVLVLPFAERWTGRETHLTLLEWGDLNRPLLQRLSLEAPGTYAHTIAIANLAEAACRAIGANAVLARVGAYYHDIGKLAKPQYFVENQPRGRNLHDKLKPNTSASIIRNHVREGLELAEAERMPRSIRAFIAEHHGTGTIAFFLEKARERDGIVANTAEYSYPGPVPQSAETAVVMLADGAEAATRALTDPTPDRIRDVVDAVVRQRLEQGQLRDAPLTLRQLTIVKQQFVRVLGGMYHARVDYPTPALGIEAIRR
jgi:putative nucleotidyltransferase with HDIG domain